jgi:hypothetical protein
MKIYPDPAHRQSRIESRIITEQEPTNNKMKTFITALISCSLTLGAIAMAQQDEEQQKAKKEKKSQQTGQAQAHPQATAAGAQAGTKRGKGAARHEEHAPTMANTPAATEGANVNAGQERGKHKGRATAHTEAATSPAATENASATVNEGAGKNKNKRSAHTEAAMKTGSPGPAANAGTSAGSGGAKIKSGTVGKNGKTVDVQQIKGQHTSFHAQAQPQKIKSVTYNQNYRIVGAERWAGPQYEVFRVYQPGWHDSGWYRSNFARVELIGGGYYYFNNGYWYPAWGYDPAAQYYAYDGPIYVGQRAEPPDQVIADVQAELQDMGYYRGEVDGLLGPLTREALTAYQADHGLYTTAAIDEPTLDALGMS